MGVHEAKDFNHDLSLQQKKKGRLLKSEDLKTKQNSTRGKEDLTKTDLKGLKKGLAIICINLYYIVCAIIFVTMEFTIEVN